MPIWVRIAGCDLDSCTIYNGVDVKVDAFLIARHSASELKTTLNAFLLGIQMPLELPPEIVDGCQAIGGICPIFVDQELEVAVSVLINTTLSNIKPDIELAMLNEVGETVMCARTTVNLA